MTARLPRQGPPTHMGVTKEMVDDFVVWSNPSYPVHVRKAGKHVAWWRDKPSAATRRHERSFLPGTQSVDDASAAAQETCGERDLHQRNEAIVP